MACQCWEQETDAAIIANVRARMKAKKKSKKSNEDGEDDNEVLEDYNEEEELTTEDMLEMQENLPAIFNTILMYLVQCTQFLFLVLMGYSSPEPEGEDKSEDEGENKSEGKDEGKDKVEEHMDLEDQEEMDVDPFADEPENELEASKGQSEGDVLDREMGGKQNGQECILDIYSPNYTMHDLSKDINMCGSIQPKDHSMFQNIIMHGLIQSMDPSSLTMHGDNSYFMDATNFHSTGTYPGNFGLLFNNLNYWTPTPGPTGQYNAFENYQTAGQVSSYSQPYNHLPNTLPMLPPVPLGNSPAGSHPLDTLLPLPPACMPNSPAPEHLPQENSQASGAKMSGAKASSAKASGAKVSGVKALGVKASKKGKPKAPAHQSENTTRKSACSPKPSTCNEMANGIGAQALNELCEKENASVVGKRAINMGQMWEKKKYLLVPLSEMSS
ncbi:hypothetical protein BDR04DRAFT_1119935 [Suillus decipiens]|nr:hypothetical protein BDR04DRAFT_1119935 [Suillus decipiens]